MNLKVPKINTTFYTSPYKVNVAAVDRALSPLLAGGAATDLMFSDPDKRPAWLRGVEYALLGRHALQSLVENRVKSPIAAANNYRSSFQNIATDLLNTFRKDPNRNVDGYQWYIPSINIFSTGSPSTLYVSKD